jgi:hypothetical protein
MTTSLDIPPAALSPLRVHLVRAAVLVAVLGVLPHLWDAAPGWKVLGTLVAGAVAARAAVLVWRAAFSTAPRDLVRG